MKRNIIEIDEQKCNGCGICIDACHEGALQLIDGKAKLVSESYCDGLGNCLPECPTGAIKIVEREAEAFDEEAVKNNMEQMSRKNMHHSINLPYSNNIEHSNNITHSNNMAYSNNLATSKSATSSNDISPANERHLACGCPGTMAKTIEKKSSPSPVAPKQEAGIRADSQLRQWPCQIKLVPVNAPYLNNAHLLVAADCTAYAYANIHEDFMKNKITIIGCPKLDEGDYSEKLTEILKRNEIKSVTVLRMEVPCCGGIVHAVKNALINSGKMIPWNVVTISTDGGIIEV